MEDTVAYKANAFDIGGNKTPEDQLSGKPEASTGSRANEDQHAAAYFGVFDGEI